MKINRTSQIKRDALGADWEDSKGCLLASNDRVHRNMLLDRLSKFQIMPAKPINLSISMLCITPSILLMVDFCVCFGVNK